MKWLAYSILAAVVITAAPSSAVRIRVQASTSDDSGVVIDTGRIVVPPLPPVPGSGSDLLMRVPPEAWQKLTPSQVEGILNRAIEAEANRSPWSHGEEFNENFLIPIVGIVSFFLALVLLVGLIILFRWRIARQRHAERIAMIERGVVDPTLLFGQTTQERRISGKRANKWTIWGVVLVFLGLGLAISDILEEGIRDAGGGFVVAAIGAGMLVAARLMRRDEETERALAARYAAQSPEQPGEEIR